VLRGKAIAKERPLIQLRLGSKLPSLRILLPTREKLGTSSLLLPGREKDTET